MHGQQKRVCILLSYIVRDHVMGLAIWFCVEGHLALSLMSWVWSEVDL